MCRYSFSPSTLRDDGARGTIRLLGEDDLDAMHASYERVRSVTNGLIVKHRAATERALADAALRFVAVEDGGAVRGFMQTSVSVAADTLRNRDELVVRDMVYEDGAYQAALFGYLRSQRDQFARVVIESQDDAFYLASTDPRDGSDETTAPPVAHRVAKTGFGVMYRILALDRALADDRPFLIDLVLSDEVAGHGHVRCGQ